MPPLLRFHSHAAFEDMRLKVWSSWAPPLLATHWASGEDIDFEMCLTSYSNERELSDPYPY